MDNPHYYGFRYVHGYGTVERPQCRTRVRIVNLHAGDPLKQVASGAVELSQAGELVDYIFVGMKQMLFTDGVRPYERYIGATAYAASSGLFVPAQKRSVAICLPVLPGMVFEIDGDDQSITTEVGFIAHIGSNFDHVFSRDISNTSDPKANPLLDIATESESDGQWRYLGLSKTTANRDLTGAYVKHYVQVNESKQVPIGAGAGI